VRRNVVITGGTRGIGQGMAREFLKRGHNVCITGRSQGSVDNGLAALAADAGDGAVIGVPCLVGDLEQVQSVWDLTAEAFGGIDIWINNAGIANIMQDFDAIEKQESDDVVETNLIGTFNGCKVALIGMKKQGGGQIYNFEGFGSDGRTGSGLSVYGTTKRAVTYFTDSLIKEYKDSPVNIGFLSPGIVITNMTLREADHLPPERWQKTKKIYNIIADKVETVTPWLVEGTLADFGKHGSRVAWLTPPKAMGRFFKAFVLRQKRDLFADLDV
jgi:NAD(P)-dependent dehydrogenase (short-subunit alcohol dehydrogenase family)